MKRILNILVCLCIIHGLTRCQTYHQPAEIVKILTDSKLNYEIGTVEIPDIDTTKYPPQISHGLFLKKTDDSKIKVVSYNIEYGHDTDYTIDLAIAESCFAAGKRVEAREAYLKALTRAPSNSQIMTFIGQTFDGGGQDSMAILWYSRAIEANYYDYMAHWFLADVCQRTQMKDRALTEIIIAKILNRNNARLQDALERIFKNSGHTYPEWGFHPRYQLARLEGNRVSVKYDQRNPEWLGYTLCKAVWQFEPGYRESMLKDAKDAPAIVEEKECIFNAIIGLQNSNEKAKDRALAVSQKALDDKMISEFVLYEIILPREPIFVFNLSPKFIESISHYVLRFRYE